MRRAFALGVAIALTACGSENSGDDQCKVAVQFDPVSPEAPATVIARAGLTNGSGVLTYDWTVSHDGTAIATAPRTPAGNEIEFVAAQPGIYEVTLFAQGCDFWEGTLNVRPPSANQHTLRLRFAPPPDSTVPGQERVVTIPGGADYDLGVISLDAGLTVPLAVRDGVGAFVPAYVRITSRATPDVQVELVTGDAGTDSVRVLPGNHDVLIVPLTGDLAPARVDDWTPGIDALAVGVGQATTGVVLGPGGPLAGARVSMVTAGNTPPSTVATTGADGRFTVRWSVPGAALAIVPPAGAGLPRLTAPLADVNLGAPLTIRYAAGLTLHDLGGLAVTVGGAPASGGSAQFAFDVASAGTIEDGVVSRLVPGSHRDTVAIDGAGRLAAYRAAGSTGRVLVRGATGPGAVVLLDLGAGLPASLDGAAPVAQAVAFVDEAGQPIRDVQVRATLDGDLAHLGAPSPAATADASGLATLLLAPGATYQLAASDPRQVHAEVRGLVAAGTTPEPFVLADAIAIRGELRATGTTTGLPSAGVTALCYQCTGIERTQPLGFAVTDGGGRFAVRLADPGIAP